MLKIELLVQFRTRPLLRENKFQFISGTKFEFHLGFGANTYPINVRTCCLRPIGFDRDLESHSMERVDQRLVQLQKWLPAGAHYKRSGISALLRPDLSDHGC